MKFKQSKYCESVLILCTSISQVTKCSDSRDKFKSKVIWNANTFYYVNISKEMIHKSSNLLLLLSQNIVLPQNIST